MESKEIKAFLELQKDLRKTKEALFRLENECEKKIEELANEKKNLIQKFLLECKQHRGELYMPDDISPLILTLNKRGYHTTFECQVICIRLGKLEVWLDDEIKNAFFPDEKPVQKLWQLIPNSYTVNRQTGVAIGNNILEIAVKFYSKNLS
jgi:hypothetical protein